MEWVETTGRNVDEAKEFALDQLGVDAEDAEFEVLTEAKSGLFSRFRSEARVRARVRPTSPRSKEETSRRRRRPEGHSKPERTEAKTESVSSESTSKPKPRRTKKPSKPTGEGAPQMDENIPLSTQGDVAVDFLGGFLDEIDADAEINSTVSEDDEIISIDIQGENLGQLIGQKGMTLQALQELTRTIVQRKTGARNGRIILDIGGWREKRRVALARFSTEIADEVKSSGEQRILEPMNPADRKVVHDTINDIDGVQTSSEGEEPRRYVVVKPGGAN